MTERIRSEQERQSEFSRDGVSPLEQTTDALRGPLHAAILRRKTQRRRAEESARSGAEMEAARTVAQGGGPLPYKEEIQAAFGGYDLSGLRAFVGGEAGEAAANMEAHGFQVADAAGFRKFPTKHDAAHEAAHYVQCREGIECKAEFSGEGDIYERHADAVADAVVAGQSAVPLLAPRTGAQGAPSLLRLKSTKKPQLAPGEAVDIKDEKAIRALTIGEFDAFARAQADWASRLSDDAVRGQLRQVLDLVQRFDLLAALEGLRVDDVLKAPWNAANKEKLIHYGMTVTEKFTNVKIPAVSEVPKALKWGESLKLLEDGIGGELAKKIIKQTDEKPQLDQLIARPHAIEKLISYYNLQKPGFQADNGVEISSFLSFLKETGDDPFKYTRLLNVRNYHRFEKASLDKVLANQEGKNTEKKPLTLAIVAAYDHNGAFHRTATMTQVLTNDKNYTILIEGAKSLGEIQGNFAGIAKKYGTLNLGKIDQVLSSGHGDAHMQEMAGDLNASGEQMDAHPIDIKNNRTETDAYFQELLKHMSNNPAHPARIVLDACLTNSNSVDPNFKFDKNPDIAERQVREAIKNNSSLAFYLKQMVDGKSNVDVKGANASIYNPNLINESTGVIDIDMTKSVQLDPKVTGTKAEYIKEGTEATGALRAVVEVWGNGRAACWKIMEDRLKDIKEHKSWNVSIIRSFYKIILGKENYKNDVGFINGLIMPAESLEMMIYSDNCRITTLQECPREFYPEIFPSLEETAYWKASTLSYIPLVFYQAWMLFNDVKKRDFMAALEKQADCNVAAQYVDVNYLNSNFESLLGPPAAEPPRASKMLALIGLANGGATVKAAASNYLRKCIGPQATDFPPSWKVSGLLAGLASTHDLLVKAGIVKDTDSGGSKNDDENDAPLQPNVDLDGDGKNDAFIEPMTRFGTVVASALHIRKGPSTRHPSIGLYPRGAKLEIIGKSGNWYAIEYKKRIAFVYADYVGYYDPQA